jgi:hypothetical protein
MVLFNDDNSPYQLMRVNRTETISLSILALLSSLLTSLTTPLTSRAAIGMGFLTVLPATGFGSVVIYSYRLHILRLVNFVKNNRPSNGPDTDIYDSHDIDKSLPPSSVPLQLSSSFSGIPLRNSLASSSSLSTGVTHQQLNEPLLPAT